MKNFWKLDNDELIIQKEMSLRYDMMQTIVHYFLDVYKDLIYDVEIVENCIDSSCKVKDTKIPEFKCVLSLSLNDFNDYNAMKSEVKNYTGYFDSLNIPYDYHRYASLLFTWLHEIGHTIHYYNVYKFSGFDGVKKINKYSNNGFGVLKKIYNISVDNNIDCSYNTPMQFIYANTYCEIQADLFVYKYFLESWTLLSDIFFNKCKG